MQSPEGLEDSPFTFKEFKIKICKYMLFFFTIYCIVSFSFRFIQFYMSRKNVIKKGEHKDFVLCLRLLHGLFYVFYNVNNPFLF